MFFFVDINVLISNFFNLTIAVDEEKATGTGTEKAAGEPGKPET